MKILVTVTMLNISKIISFLTGIGVLIFLGVQANQNIGATHLPVVNSNDYLTYAPLKTESDSIVSGTLVPKGPPISPPVRVEAGNNCIVDLVQTYSVTGTLSGIFEIDYRILVYGPCGVPPGTYDEEWIAYGIFDGYLAETTASGKFSYTAQ